MAFIPFLAMVVALLLGVPIAFSLPEREFLAFICTQAI